MLKEINFCKLRILQLEGSYQDASRLKIFSVSNYVQSHWQRLKFKRVDKIAILQCPMSLSSRSKRVLRATEHAQNYVAIDLMLKSSIFFISLNGNNDYKC